jgi:hypothetical protein
MLNDDFRAKKRGKRCFFILLWRLNRKVKMQSEMISAARDKAEIAVAKKTTTEFETSLVGFGSMRVDCRRVCIITYPPK